MWRCAVNRTSTPCRSRVKRKPSTVRIAGQTVFDVDDKTAREIYAANPVLPRLYRAYTDLAYFRLPAVSLDYYDLTPDPPLQEHYDYEQK